MTKHTTANKTAKRATTKKASAKKAGAKPHTAGAKKKTAKKATPQTATGRPIPTGPRAGSSATQPRNAGVDQLAFATGGGTSAPEAQVESARQAAALRGR
jgi:hypothetical protein